MRWVNADDTEHTVTSLPSAETRFDSGRQEPREIFEEAFVDIGVYPYESETERGVRATVTVLGD